MLPLVDLHKEPSGPRLNLTTETRLLACANEITLRLDDRFSLPMKLAVRETRRGVPRAVTPTKDMARDENGSATETTQRAKTISGVLRAITLDSHVGTAAATFCSDNGSLNAFREPTKAHQTIGDYHKVTGTVQIKDGKRDRDSLCIGTKVKEERPP